MSCSVRFALKNSSDADSSRNRPPQNGRVRRHRWNLLQALSVATYPPETFAAHGMAEARGCVPRAPILTSEAFGGLLVREIRVDLQVEPAKRERTGLSGVSDLLQVGDGDVFGFLRETADGAVGVLATLLQLGRVPADGDVVERGVAPQLGQADQQVVGLGRVLVVGARVDGQADRRAVRVHRLAQVVERG